MINWHDIEDAGRERYAARLDEAERDRLLRRSREVRTRRTPLRSLRSRVGRALIAWGHWLDGRTEQGAY